MLEAEEEGLQLHFLVNPTRVIGNGRVTGLELVRQELGDFDASARRRPIPIEGSEFVLPVDIVIAAIGQSTDVRCAEDCGVAFNRNTTVQVGRDFAATKPGVFAAGDAVLGPATVVEAVAQGNEVALAVDAYLQNGTPISKEGWLDYTDVPLTWVMEDYAEAVRAEVPVRTPRRVASTGVRSARIGGERAASSACAACGVTSKRRADGCTGAAGVATRPAPHARSGTSRGRGGGTRRRPLNDESPRPGPGREERRRRRSRHATRCIPRYGSSD